MTKRPILLAFPLTLAACTQPAPDPAPSATPTERVGPVAAPRDEPGGGQMRDNAVEPAATAALEERYLGRWIGVEGLNLTVTKLAEPGHYQLEMQYGTDADMAGTYEGVGTPEGIAFTRPDGAQVLRASSGDETGLKYLAGKTDCLKVKDGEGYCRQ